MIAAEMRDQLLLCKEENAILPLVNPDGEMGLFSRISNEEHRSQLIQFGNLVQGDLCFRFAPLVQENLLIQAGHKRMRAFGHLF